MLPLIETSEYDLWVSQLLPPFRFKAPFAGQDFALLLWGTDSQASLEVRALVCQEIVRQGCRYAVCAGEQCELWHDMIDDAYLAESSDDSPPSDRVMVTTWHDNEPLDEVLSFFRECATFDGHRPRRLLILVLGGDSELCEEVSTRLNECFARPL